MADLERARIIALTLLGEPPIEQSALPNAVENAINAVASQKPDANVDPVDLLRELEANVSVVVGSASTLTGENSDHIPWLPGRRGSIGWNFSRRYRRFLKEKKGWALMTLQRSDDLTDRILGLLEDPNRHGQWDRRGMVVGEVQSGKTSNYIELICKAADAGYKFIVVLTGTTNSLRAQTQLRLDEGFLGWDTRLNLALESTNKRVGVGTLLGENLLRAIPSTNADERGDFNLNIANQFNVRLGGDPVIMVVKKNAAVLRNLTRWARSLSLADNKKPIPDLPILVIDDEADYASINTNIEYSNSDEDPTRINGRIRDLLQTFQKSAYIGYTATPFANIFINPEVDGEIYGRDLFPRDFLINLPVPSNHVGPTKLFGLPEGDDNEARPALPLVRTINDHYSHIPDAHKSDWQVDRLPNSLIGAMKAFILSCAIRAARGQAGQHNSMLIHVTRFVAVQGQIADLVRSELRSLQNSIRYGDGDSPDSIIDQLRSMWLADFRPTSNRVRQSYPELTTGCTDVPWDEISSKLVEASQKIEVKVINGAAKDALDYQDHPEGLSSIAIGGDKLSRGLTLEGLSVSYYLRASRMYDTLLQMGRWFGYRPGFVDICRLYTTGELQESYSHIAMATEELRQEFNTMADLGMTPNDFGLKVRSHPAGLSVTAANKMRNGTRMMVSYSSAYAETLSFDRDPDVIQRNYGRYSEFISSLAAPQQTQSSRHLTWDGVDGSEVAELLENVSIRHESWKARGDRLADYILRQNMIGGLVRWTVVLVSNRQGSDSVDIGGHAIHPVSRSRYDAADVDSKAVYRIRRLLTPSHEELDLTADQIKTAREKTIQAYLNNPDRSRHRDKPRRPSGPYIRLVRKPENGLLLIYPIRENEDSEGLPHMGYAVSFPVADKDTPAEYVVNNRYSEDAVT